jgi:hypothetical protein
MQSAAGKAATPEQWNSALREVPFMGVIYVVR